MNNTHKAFSVIIILCSLCFNPVEAYALDKFSATILAFQQRLANEGDAQAQYKLALMYESGHGASVDFDEAIKWYQLAAAQNHEFASERLTYLQIRQSSFEKDKHQEWLNTLILLASVEIDNGDAILLLGQLYKDGIGVKQDIAMAQKLFRRAVIKEVPGSEVELETVAILD